MPQPSIAEFRIEVFYKKDDPRGACRKEKIYHSWLFDR